MFRNCLEYVWRWKKQWKKHKLLFLQLVQQNNLKNNFQMFNPDGVDVLHALTRDVCEADRKRQVGNEAVC